MGILIKNTGGTDFTAKTRVDSGEHVGASEVVSYESIVNGAETAVSTAAVQVLAANPNRTVVALENRGNATVRYGASGVTATTGWTLLPGQMVFFPAIVAIFAIRVTSDSTVWAGEITR